MAKRLDFVKKFFHDDVVAYRTRLYFDESWLVMSVGASPEDARWLEHLTTLSGPRPERESGAVPEAHLVLVTASLHPGGAERQWCYLARELAERGYQVTLLTVKPLEGDNAHYLPLLEGSGVRVLGLDRVAVCEEGACFPPSQTPIDAWLLATALEHLRPSHVLIQLDYCNIWCGAAALMQRVPPMAVLFSFRSLNPARYSIYTSYFHTYYRILCRSSRVVLNANSQFGGEDYARWIGIDPMRVGIAHNAVELPRLLPQTREELRRDLGIAATAPVVLGVFRFSAEKNPMLFLEVARAVHAALPGAVFLHAGLGPDDCGMREAAEEPGMRGWVRLLGRREDVHELMRAADVLLLCSDIESLPNVVLEAQAAELPVVSTRVGGSPEAMREGETGLLAGAGDVEGLASCCIELLRDPERRRRMGEAGRKFLEANFSHKALGDAILAQIGLPERAPEGAAARQTRFPGEITLSVRYRQCMLEELLQEHPEMLRRPLLLFAPIPLSRKVAALMPPRSLCLTLPGVGQPGEMPAMELDWREPHTYTGLKGKVCPGSCALIMGDWPQWENMEGRLWASGVRWLVVLWGSKWYSFPLLGRKLWHELHGFFRKVQRKIKKRLGGSWAE